MNKYCKQGYIQKEGRKPYYYSLTEKGKLHAHNPYICRERFANKLDVIVSKYGTDIGMDVAVKYLSGDDDAKLQIEEYLKSIQDDKPDVVETVQKVIEVMPVPQEIEPIDDEYGEVRVHSYEELLKGNELANSKITELNAEINRLRNQSLNMGLQMQKRTIAPKKPANAPPKSPERKDPSVDMIKRFNLINDWQKRYLKKIFFDNLGHFQPYIITGSSNVKELMMMKLKRNEIVIMDKRSASSMVNNRFCRELNAKEILEQAFHLEWQRDGTYIASEVPGVKAYRVMKRADYSKCSSLEKKRV
ncbi:hypothetical protein [Methanococcoides alaskense]|uniref:Uncharacterized protein n=1 Tax=Methanococcoides alaskense TaxID=325778 RepID=A0AA90Z6E4_9EURY|nr:hypothetical protein [Methanococcoides alaskense]MDA0525150.1 hypothetical protein [Methanococcoides alaskense]MDR6221929.1 hypothetical protein [Methanococcoides alaskense]